MTEEPTEVIDRCMLGDLVAASTDQPTKLISRSELSSLLVEAVPPQVQIRFIQRPIRLHTPDGNGTVAAEPERPYSRFAAIAVSAAITLGAGLMVAMMVG